MARLIEVGRLELKGAQARFKQKGTLEASDRNLAALMKVLVRVTPAPEMKLFADFVFAEEIFRVFQEATLVNYKDFLEKVEFSGIDNFRALVRYTSRALSSADTATVEFAEKNRPAERFVSKEEMAAYEEAVLGGGALPGREAGGAAPGTAAVSEAEKRAIAEREWKKFAVELAQAKAEEPNATALAGGLLTVVGAAILLASLFSLRIAMKIPEDAIGPGGGRAPHVYPLIALGGVTGMALATAGLLYLRKQNPR